MCAYVSHLTHCDALLLAPQCHITYTFYSCYILEHSFRFQIISFEIECSFNRMHSMLSNRITVWDRVCVCLCAWIYMFVWGEAFREIFIIGRNAIHYTIVRLLLLMRWIILIDDIRHRKAIFIVVLVHSIWTSSKQSALHSTCRFFSVASFVSANQTVYPFEVLIKI